MKPVRTIKYVARQTGLTVHTIRIWEKRYAAVEPLRVENKRRLYSEEDVERLRLLREATLAGHAIGQIARATLPELERLVREAGAGATPPAARPRRSAERQEAAEELCEQGLVAITALNAHALRKLLDRAAVELGSSAVLQRVISPLAHQVGELWRAGEMSIAHEHFATDQITDFLNSFARPYSENMSAPHLVIATPTGQLHELGAITAAAAARSHGWRTTYLGAALPVEELAGAVRNLQPRAVGLSIIFPPDDAALRGDLRKLRELLPKECALIIGGQSAPTYLEVLREIKAIMVQQIDELFPVLDKLRRTPTVAPKPRKK